MSRTWSRIIVVVAFAALSFSGFAQPKYNSPYSRIGLGDLFDQNFVGQAGMGGLSTAFQDPYHLNFSNPASYSHLLSTSFEVGLNARLSNFKNNSDGTSAGVWGGNLSYLALGFPMRNSIHEILDPVKKKVKWGMGIALVPFTTVGYNIVSQDLIPGADTVRYLFQGSGGTYRLLWGNSVRVNNFSVGLNTGFLFGEIKREHQVRPDEFNSYEENFQDEFSVRGFVWDIGVQYELELDKDRPEDEASKKKIIFGLTGASNNGFTTNTTQLYRAFNPTINDLDTISAFTDLEGKGTLPGKLSFSAIYEKTNKLKVGAQVDLTSWSQYTNDAKPETLNNTFRAAAGLQFIPDITSYNKYSRRIRYRLGAFYAQDPRSVFNNSLTNYGISLGLGMPIILPRQQTSFVNVALELGQFGNSTSLQETYAKLSVGFTLNDNSWFYKRKFK